MLQADCCYYKTAQQSKKSRAGEIIRGDGGLAPPCAGAPPHCPEQPLGPRADGSPPHLHCVISRVGHNRICTIYNHIFGDFPAKNTIYTPCIDGSDQP
jgi:hypothetical protein